LEVLELLKIPLPAFAAGGDAIGCEYVTEDVMAKSLVDDELWMVVEPLLPRRKPRPKGGKPPADDRVCLTGILFVLKTGIAWEDFPQEMGCCGMTLLNRLRQWQKDGVWDRMHRVMLDKLRAAGGIDFSRVIVDSSSIRAMHGGKKREKAPWTAEKWDRNTTSWLMPTACRWQ
jgi:transposase